MVATVPRRRSIRLPNYDYSSDGLYFVTICTRDRLCLFGQIIDTKMHLSDTGKIVDEVWSVMFGCVEADTTWIVMPNHLHGIITIDDQVIAAGAGKSLGRKVGAFKTATTNRVNEIRATPGARLWQRGFHEHIVRDDRSFANIVRYIEDNPFRWGNDAENPDGIPSAPCEREGPRNR
jgi:putative transposase